MTGMTDESTLDIADRFFKAIEAGDLDSVRSVLSDDAVIYSNFGGENGVDHTLKILGWLTRRADGLRYEITRRDEIEGGFLQEHVLTATAPNGTAISMPACVVVTMADGKIVRLHEYLDPSHVEPLRHG